MREAARRRLERNRALPAGNPDAEGKSKSCQSCSCSAGPPCLFSVFLLEVISKQPLSTATKKAHAEARGEVYEETRIKEEE